MRTSNVFQINCPCKGFRMATKAQEDVLSIRRKLEKITESGEQSQALDLLKRLSDIDMNLSILTNTRIGMTVNALRQVWAIHRFVSLVIIAEFYFSENLHPRRMSFLMPRASSKHGRSLFQRTETKRTRRTKSLSTTPALMGKATKILAGTSRSRSETSPYLIKRQLLPMM